MSNKLEMKPPFPIGKKKWLLHDNKAKQVTVKRWHLEVNNVTFKPSGVHCIVFDWWPFVSFAGEEAKSIHINRLFDTAEELKAAIFDA